MTADDLQHPRGDRGRRRPRDDLRIVNATTPDDPDSVENLRWSNATYPGTSRFIAEDGGQPIGVGTVGRIYMHAPEFEAFWATVTVVAARPSAGRRHGPARRRSRTRARERGKHVLHMPASEARPEGIDFLLHRGFEEYERSKSVSLDLTGLTPPPADVPDGIVLTTLAERPDLAEAVYAVAIEAFADIPGGETPMATGDPRRVPGPRDRPARDPARGVHRGPGRRERPGRRLRAASSGSRAPRAARPGTT